MQPNPWQPFHLSYRWLRLGFALLFAGVLLWPVSYPVRAAKTQQTSASALPSIDSDWISLIQNGGFERGNTTGWQTVDGAGWEAVTGARDTGWVSILQNGGFDTGNFSGWQIGSGSWVVEKFDMTASRCQTCPYSVAKKGGTNPGWIAQEVDVSPYQSLINVGAGSVDAYGYIRTQDGGDKGRVVVQYKSGATVLATYDSGYKAPGYYWEQGRDARTIPVGTDRIRFEFWLDTDGDGDCKIDSGAVQIRMNYEDPAHTGAYKLKRLSRTEPSSIYQDISLGEWQSTINQGLGVIHAGAWLKSIDPIDHLRVQYTFFSSSDVLVENSYDSGWVHPATWSQYGAEQPIPVGANKIRITLSSTGDADAVIDDVFADVQFQPIPTPTASPTLIDSPTPIDSPAPTSTAVTITATPTSTPTSTPISTPTSTPTTIAIYEPNDTCSTARPITVDGTVQFQTFTTAIDDDWVAFTAEAGIDYLIEALTPLGSTADVRLFVYGSCSGVAQEGQDNIFSPDVRLRFIAPTAGPIYLYLRNENSSAGANQPYQLSVRRLDESNATSAVILIAGRYRNNDPLQTNIYQGTEAVYKLFQNRGYPTDRIYYIAPETRLNGLSKPATTAEVQAAITQWALDKVSNNGALTLYLFDHGASDRFYLDEPRGQRITPHQLDTWLTALEATRPGIHINVIYEACYSGSFIEAPGTISKPGRVIITSAPADGQAFASQQGAIFSDLFFAQVAQGSSLYTSFQVASQNTSRLYLQQIAWLDDDGDGIANATGEGQEAQRRGFAFAGSFIDDAWPPFIAQAQLVDTIVNGRGVLQAHILADDSNPPQTAWAIIYPPDYEEPVPDPEIGDMVPEPEPLPLISRGNNIWSAATSNFTQPGVYRVVVQAQSRDGLFAQPLPIEVLVAAPDSTHQVYLPFVQAR